MGMLGFSLFNFGVIFPLAIIGLWILKKNPVRELLLLFIGGYSLAVILFFIADRYRLPVVPYLIIAAAVALVDVFKRAREHSWPGLKKEGLILVVGGLITFWSLSVPPNIWENNFRGIKYMMKENFPNAIAEFQKQITRTPGDYETLINLGTCYFEEGEFERAETCFRNGIKQDSGIITAYFNLGILYHRQGDQKNAEDILQKGLTHQPEHTGSLFLLARIYHTAGRTREAIDLLENLRRIDAENPEINDFLNRIIPRRNLL